MGPPGSEALFGPTGRSRGDADARPPFPNPIPNGHKDGSASTALYKSQLAVTHRETDPLPFPLPASPKISASSSSPVPAQLTLTQIERTRSSSSPRCRLQRRGPRPRARRRGRAAAAASGGAPTPAPSGPPRPLLPVSPPALLPSLAAIRGSPFPF